jgi:hypothetical protein
MIRHDLLLAALACLLAASVLASAHPAAHRKLLDTNLESIHGTHRALFASTNNCTECQDCVTNACFNQCWEDCEPAVEFRSTCQHVGRDSAADVVDIACRNAMRLCSGRKVDPIPTRFVIGTGTLNSAEQCQHIAAGVCQHEAKHLFTAPCKDERLFGYVQCDGERFSEIYIAQTHALCMNANLLRRR